MFVTAVCFLFPLLSFFFLIPQILIASITLLQKFTPHFKILDPRLKWRICNLAQKIWKAFKIEAASDGVSCENTTENFDRLVAQTLCQNYSRQELFQRSIAVTALAFRTGCMMVIAGQFQSQQQKISSRPPWWFFVSCEEPGQLRFSSNYSTSWGVFRKDRIVGVSWC